MNLEHVQTFLIGTSVQVENRDYSVYDIALGPAGVLYVANYRHNEVLLLDKNLKFLGALENIPTPHGIGVSGQGEVYVATHRAGRLLKFSKNREEISDWDAKLRKQHLLRQPVTVAVDFDHYVYVGDYERRCIVKVDGQGNFLMDFTIKKKGRPEMLPHGVVTDGGGRVYVADRANFAIQVFSSDGRYITAWVPRGRSLDPLAVRFLSEDVLVVPDYKTGALHLFGLDGSDKGIFGSLGNGPCQFAFATNVVSDGGSALFVSEENGNRIQKCRVFEE